MDTVFEDAKRYIDSRIAARAETEDENKRVQFLNCHYVRCSDDIPLKHYLLSLNDYLLEKAASLPDYEEVKDLFANASREIKARGSYAFAKRAWKEGKIEDTVNVWYNPENAITWAWKAKAAYENYNRFYHSAKNLQEARDCAAKAREYMEKGQAVPRELEEVLQALETARAGKQTPKSILELLDM